jgi:histidinol-phosphate aminotransferase
MGAQESASKAHPGQLATAAVLSLSPYVPGKPISELAREYGIEHIDKLASNENPYGPSPAALAAMHEALAEAWLYPDGSAHELKQALAAHLGVAAACITVGNGSNEMLLMLAETFMTAHSSAVYSQYGFAIYPLVIRATGARAIEVPALGAGDPMRYGHDLKSMAEAIAPDTKLVFIANPNNPTGTWVDRGRLHDFIAQAPAHTLIVLDEAYVEYAQFSGCGHGLEWGKEFPNLVLVRTLSKAYGMAGLRVGYALSHPEVADALNRIRPAFNVSNVAQAGAIAALGDQAHVLKAARLVVEERERVSAALRSMKFPVVPSAGNFLLVEVGAAAQVYEQLLRGGVIVRPVAGYGLPRHLRISIGLPEQNDRLLRLLGALQPSA